MTINKEIADKFSSYPVFTYRDVKLYFKGRKKETKNLARILSYMKKSGKIYTIAKGTYSLSEDSIVSGFAFRPFYYGLLSALTINGLWTQISKPDIITIKRVRSSRISIFNDKDNVIFIHHIPAKYFFGFDIIKYGRFTVPVSDCEKTLIDMFYYRTKLAIQEYGELLRKINEDKLNQYLKKYDKRTKLIVLNFIKKYKPMADSGKLESPY